MTLSIKQRLEKLLAQMSLDEKIAQMGSYWVYELQTKGELDSQKVAVKLKDGIGQITRIGGASTLDPVSAAKVANSLQKFLVERTRLGIPAILHEECCMGAMLLGGTMYPQMLGLAATFQPELAKAMTTAIRKQMRAIGARQGLAPVLDIACDVRWGRVEETFGEDPILASRFGVSYIKGLQGEDLTEGVMATGKHFIGHSLSQGGLNCGPVRMGMNEIYDIYLSPFHAAIRDAGLATIMNAYPELDGEVVATSRRILTDLLRKELGFEGLVVADYEAIIMINNFHYVAADEAQAACIALEAGIDVELPTCVCYSNPLKAALEAGDISLEAIDRSVSRHLQKKFELGLFENPYVDEGKVLEVFETPENRSLAREIAHQSMVLLKNDGILPLSKTSGSLAVIGPNADEGRNLLGDYSYTSMKELFTSRAIEDSSFVDLNPASIAPHEVSVMTILESVKMAVSAGTKILYVKGCDNLEDDTSQFVEAVEIARKADVVILVLGDRSGLIPSCTTGETRDNADLRLPGVQEGLAKAILATGKPVVVVLVNGRPFAIPWLSQEANAILEAWLPGEEGGAAVADVLFGDVNPGGKLPITFPRSVGQLPIFYNHKPSGMRSHWYVDYVREKVTPLYPFGHGLSYTSFEYDDLHITPAQAMKGEKVDVSFRIANSGAVTGDEVVQLYVRDEFASIPRPMKELKGFVRVRLRPGEGKTVTFHLPVNQLAFFDNTLSLVLEPGRIFVMIGSSSDDIRLSGEFEITSAAEIPIRERVFVCLVDID
jgi:beta-glucosidase